MHGSLNVTTLDGGLTVKPSAFTMGKLPVPSVTSFTPGTVYRGNNGLVRHQRQLLPARGSHKRQHIPALRKRDPRNPDIRLPVADYRDDDNPFGQTTTALVEGQCNYH